MFHLLGLKVSGPSPLASRAVVAMEATDVKVASNHSPRFVSVTTGKQCTPEVSALQIVEYDAAARPRPLNAGIVKQQARALLFLCWKDIIWMRSEITK